MRKNGLARRVGPTPGPSPKGEGGRRAIMHLNNFIE